MAAFGSQGFERAARISAYVENPSQSPRGGNRTISARNDAAMFMRSRLDGANRSIQPDQIETAG